MHTSSSVISLNAVSFAWPDGSEVLSGITTSFSRGRTGLVGSNGAGKSTLMRVIAGELAPSSGSVTLNTTAHSGTSVAWLRQDITRETTRSLGELMRIQHTLDAIAAIEAGDVRQDHFDTIGEDWDIELRARATLRTHPIGSLDADDPQLFARTTDSLSGGEVMLASVLGVNISGADIALLDEPSNNLDRQARAQLASIVQAWPRTLLLISHDTELLELMDMTAELHHNRIRQFGGGFSAYRETIEHEQAAAARDLRAAEGRLATEKRQRAEQETKIARREKAGRAVAASKSLPKILLNQRKSNAQGTAGRLRSEAGGKVSEAASAVDQAERRIRSDDSIVIELPDPELSAKRRVLDGEAQSVPFSIRGPERIALTGPNGSGKTTLVEAIVACAEGRPSPQSPGTPATITAVGARVGYLRQKLDGLDDAASVLENLKAQAAGRSDGELRQLLARFRIRGDAAFQTVSTLSGGERFRVALARELLADPVPELMILDEPSNNLDLVSVSQLVDALAAYRGALLVVSHDEVFLDQLGLDTRWILSRDEPLVAVPFARAGYAEPAPAAEPASYS